MSESTDVERYMRQIQSIPLLFADALRVVIQHLNLSDLHVFGQVCPQWYQLIQLTKPIKQCKRMISGQTFIRLTTDPSTLERQVTELGQWQATVPPFSLYSLTDRLPNLRELALINTIEPHIQTNQHDQQVILKSHDGMQLPKMIESIFTNTAVNDVPVLLRAISKLEHLTELRLGIPYDILNRGLLDVTSHWWRQQYNMLLLTDWMQLQSLHRLSKLSISIYLPPHILAEAKSVSDVVPNSITSLIPSLPALTALDLGYPWDTLMPWLPDIIRLVAPKRNELKLIKFNFGCKCTESILETLCHISTITELNLSLDIPISKYVLLAEFPYLTYLRLDDQGLNGLNHEKTIAAAKAAAKMCPQITSLEVQIALIQATELNDIVSSLPQLTILCLIKCSVLNSLSFLLNHGLPRRLKEFGALQCAQLPNSELENLYHLQQLTHLVLMNSEMPDDLKRQLTFGSPDCKLPQASNPAARTAL